jgi:integrase
MRGSVIRRGQTYTYWVDLPPDPATGKRRQKTKGGFRTKRECQAALNQVIAELRGGTYVPASKRTVASFLVDEWLPAVQMANLRPGSWANYRIHVTGHILPNLGPVELQALSPAQLNAFYRHLLTEGGKHRRGLAPKTVRNIHNILHRALRDAVRWGYLVRNVADAADPPKGKLAPMRVWTPEQLRAFLAHVRDDRLHAAWLLLATTGMRRGELAGLRWVDVDLQAGRLSVLQPRIVVDHKVRVSEPKSARGRRSIALDSVTIAALQAHKKRPTEDRLLIGPGYKETGLVFTWPDGSEIHPARFSDWFQQHVRRARLPRIRLHDVRHSYASAALAAGIPAKVMSERLGHATIAVTMDIYSHVLPGLDERAAQTVAGLILGDPAALTEGSVNNPLAQGKASSDERQG